MHSQLEWEYEVVAFAALREMESPSVAPEAPLQLSRAPSASTALLRDTRQQQQQQRQQQQQQQQQLVPRPEVLAPAA